MIINQNKQIFIKSICIYLLSIFFLFNPVQADDSWKRPLSEKADIIEDGIQKRHNILGLYPSMVEIPFDSDTIDITTRNPMADIQHAVCWTANYLAGLSYRYAYLKQSNADSKQIERARKRADEVFEGVYRCQRVTGVQGLQARVLRWSWGKLCRAAAFNQASILATGRSGRLAIALGW